MYNKIFTKILDSSIWLAPDPQRIVWITFLAAMDEDGNAMFASVANVASRARVSIEDARSAIAAFEGPDPDSGDPDNEGRRIERFPGGWHVLNAHKYRAMVTKTIIREQTRLRVEKHRSKTSGNAAVTQCNAPMAESNASVTPSVALALSESKNKGARKRTKPPVETVSRETLMAAGFDPKQADDFLACKLDRKAPLTVRAWEDHKREAAKAGWTPVDAAEKVMAKTWKGFEAKYVADEVKPRAGASSVFAGAL